LQGSSPCFLFSLFLERGDEPREGIEVRAEELELKILKKRVLYTL
jgi:hypothetical protein